MQTLPQLNKAGQDYAFIAFALMGALVDSDAACRKADAALKAKGCTDDTIAQARAAVETRIQQWGRP